MRRPAAGRLTHVSRLRVMRIIARMNVGGPAVEVAGLMRNLSSAEFEHRLWTGWCGSDEVDYILSQAPDIEATRIIGLGRAINIGDDARALANLVLHIRRFRPHIVHTHTAKAGVLGRIAVRLAGSGAATVHTFHGHLLSGYFSPAKTRAVIASESTLAKATDRIVTVGPQVRDDLLAAGIGTPAQYRVILSGLELPPAIPRGIARSALGLHGHGPVISFIGRLAPIKRPDRFIAAARRIHLERPDVQFLVAGDGSEGNIIREAAQDLPITMLGWRNDVQNILAASDAVLLTSDNEGTPLSLIEAGLAGLPVVATDVGSVSDVVIDGQTGWLARCDAASIASSTLELLSKPHEARRRGEAARERALERHGVVRFAEEHARLYREITLAHPS